MPTVEIIRPDLIFSYWIFVWVILYFLRIVPIGPKLLLILGLVENVGSFVFLYNLPAQSSYNLFRFVFINFWLKVVPLYYLWKQKITRIEIWYSLVVSLVHLAWISIHHESIRDIFNQITQAYSASSEKKTLLAYLYDRIYSSIPFFSTH
jgi:hypothetical protein